MPKWNSSIIQNNITILLHILSLYYWRNYHIFTESIIFCSGPYTMQRFDYLYLLGFRLFWIFLVKICWFLNSNLMKLSTGSQGSNNKMPKNNIFKWYITFPSFIPELWLLLTFPATGPNDPQCFQLACQSVAVRSYQLFEF